MRVSASTSKNGSIRDGLKKSMLPPASRCSGCPRRGNRHARSRRGRIAAADRRCPAAAGRRWRPWSRCCSGCGACEAAVMPTSKRTGSVGAAVVDAERCRGRPGEVEEVRVGLDALRPHAVLQDDRAVQQERARAFPASARSASMIRAEAVGIADRHPFAGRRQADRPSAKPLRPMRPPNVTLPPPSRAGHLVDADAAGIERDGAVDRLERVRQRELTQAAVVHRRAAREHRLGRAVRSSAP